MLEGVVVLEGLVVARELLAEAPHLLVEVLVWRVSFAVACFLSNCMFSP